MTIPAARLMHAYFCNLESSAGAIIGPCSPDVFVGGLIAAKLTDQCLCTAHHQSPIAEGAAEVLINGFPAARLGMHSLNGGEIRDGDSSVLIGGATFALPPFITIEGSADYQTKVLRDLYVISTTPDGQMLFASMAATGRKVRIHERELLKKDNDSCTTDPRDEDSLTPNNPHAFDGSGSDAQIEYDPDDWKNNWPKDQQRPGVPRDPTLFHEMMHADDIMHGRLDHKDCVNPGGYPGYVPCSERKACGLPPYDDTSKYPYSENTYRDSRGLPRRPTY